MHKQALFKAYDEQNSSEVLPPPRKSKSPECCNSVATTNSSKARDGTSRALPFLYFFIIS